MKALKDKNETLKKQAEETEASLADLKKKLRTAEGEAKKAQVQNSPYLQLMFCSFTKLL